MRRHLKNTFLVLGLSGVCLIGMTFAQNANSNKQKPKQVAQAKTAPQNKKVAQNKSANANKPSAGKQTPARNQPQNAKGKLSKQRAPSRAHLRRPELKEKDVRQAIEILKLFDPQLAQELAQKFQSKPREVSQMLYRRFPRLGPFMRLKHYDPEMFELRVAEIKRISEARHLAIEYREAMAIDDMPLAEELKQELRQTLEYHFDAQSKIHQLQIDRWQIKLNELRTQLTNRRADKSELIQSQMDILSRGRTNMEDPLQILKPQGPPPHRNAPRQNVPSQKNKKSSAAKTPSNPKSTAASKKPSKRAKPKATVNQS